MGAAVRGSMNYRLDFVASTIGVALLQSVNLAFVMIIVQRFGAIGGWGLGEIALLYGMRAMSHAIFTVPFAGLHRMSQLVREGTIDRFLVRPTGIFNQVVTYRFQVMTSGDLLAGAGILTAAALLAPIDWSPAAVGYLVLAVIGGGMIELAINTFVMSLTFRFLSIRSAQIVIDNVLSSFGGYPLSIFPTPAALALTWLFPLAFLAYFPATVLLDRSDELSVHPGIAYAAPAIGFALAAAAYLFWKRQIRHYKSTGH